MAVRRARITIGVRFAAAAAIPDSKPESTEVTTVSSSRPPSVCSSGAKRTSAYTTPSAARSSTHSLATRSSASLVCMTPTVCVKPSRYRTRSRRGTSLANHCASATGSVLGKPL